MSLFGTKGSWGCCTIGEHTIDKQGFPPCHITLGRLFYWEETKMNRQIKALIKLGKTKNSDSEYAFKVNLHVKKDGNMQFYGDYRSLNMQTKRDSFPTP